MGSPGAAAAGPAAARTSAQAARRARAMRETRMGAGGYPRIGQHSVNCPARGSGNAREARLRHDERLPPGPAAVLRRRVLVEVVRRAVAQRAQVRAEAAARRVDVEEHDLRVARVAVGVDDERRHDDECARPGGHLAGAEAHGQLARKDVEHVVVAAVNVRVGARAARAEPRARHVHRVDLAQDLDATIGGVGDDLGRHSHSVSNFGLTWMSSWRSGPSPELTNECATPAGTITTSPARTTRSSPSATNVASPSSTTKTSSYG